MDFITSEEYENTVRNILKRLDGKIDKSGGSISGDVDITGTLSIKSQNELRFYDNGNYVGFEAPALSGNQIWVLPDADGGANEALGTDGGGNLIWRNHDELAGYVADEHIDWTNATDNLSTSGNIFTTGGHYYAPNDAKIYFRDVGDTGYIRALNVNTNDHTTLNASSGKDIIFMENVSAKMRLVSGDFGIGTNTPATVASASLGGTVLHVLDSSADGRLVASGATGANLNLVDTGGGSNDKWLQLDVDGGIGKFASVADAGTSFVSNNILVMDLGNGNVGIGTNTPGDELEVNGNIMANGIGLGKSPTQLIDMQAESALCPIYMTAITSTSQWQSPQILTRRARGTVGSISAVADGDLLYRNDIYAYDGSDYVLAGHIRCQMQDDPTDVGNITPCSLGFAVQDSSGNLRIATQFGEYFYLQHGVLAMAETTTPSAIARVGKLYTKSDNKLYFQDGGGTEHEMAYA